MIKSRVGPRALSGLAGTAIAAGTLAASLMMASAALAQPTGGSVVAGSANINQSGSTTTITAGNGTIINWQSFNIPVGTGVTFVQPGATSTVLNRVLGNEATSINGTLSANGQVWIVNPAGVMFGPSAVVDVGQLYAAAGSISDEDFLSGTGRLSLTGAVQNYGTLKGGVVALAGTSVLNAGSIVAPEGTVVLMAGSEAYVGQRDGAVFARVDLSKGPPAGADPKTWGVENTGVIDAAGGRVAMLASDYYAMAIHTSGTVRAADIAVTSSRVDGQAPSLVEVGGTLDASNASGNGGLITIVGDRVLVNDARLTVSGSSGGGEVRIGGGERGQGTERNANRVLVSAGSVIEADATGQGNGGRVLVWSEQATAFGGTISARGGKTGGDGGFAEVSSKGALSYTGVADLRADFGKLGTLLLDPRDLIAAAAGSAVTGDILFGDNPGIDVTISVADLITQLGLANLVLEASRDLIVQAAINSGSTNSLTLSAGRSLLIQADITLGGAFTGIANSSSANVVLADRGAGAGVLTMDPGTTITAGGTVTLRLDSGAGGGQTSGDITLGSINAGSNTVLVEHLGTTTAGRIVQNSGASITAGATALRLTASDNGSIGTNGDAITINGGTIALDLTPGSAAFIASPAGLTVGQVLDGATVVGDGVRVLPVVGNTSAVSVEIVAGGALTINRAINTPAATIRLASVGAMTQGADGNIIAGLLAAVNTGTGGIDLSNAGNTFGTLAASTAGTGQLRFRTSSALSIDELSGGSARFNGGNVVTGISADADTTIVAGGALAIQRAMNVGAGVLRLAGAGGVTQTAQGAITAAGLGVINTGTGSVDLTAENAGTSVNTVSGVLVVNNAAVGGGVAFRNTLGITVGNLARVTGLWVDPANAGATGLFGIGTIANAAAPFTNDVLLVSDTGSIALQDAILAASGTVRLLAVSGVSQTGAGTITAGRLAVINTASGSINLNLTNSITGAVALRNESTSNDDGIVMVTGGGPLTIGVVGGNPAGFNSGTDLAGASTGRDQDITLATGGVLTLQRAVNAGAGTVRLRSGTGMAQDAAGVITAGTLGVINTSSGSINLNAENQIATALAGVNRATNGALTFRNATGFTVDSVSTITGLWADPGDAAGTTILGLTTVGPSSGTGTNDVNLNAGTGSLVISQAINAGRGTTRLMAATGISQTGDGLIVTGNLGAINTTSGNIILSLNNRIGSESGSATTGTIQGTAALVNQATGGEVFLRNVAIRTLDAVTNTDGVRTNAPYAGDLTLGTISFIENLFFSAANTGATGVRAVGDANVTILTPGTLTINGGIQAGTRDSNSIIRIQTGLGINQGQSESAAVIGGTLAVVNASSLAPVAWGTTTDSTSDDDPTGVNSTRGRAAFFNNFNNVRVLTGRNENNAADVSIFNIGSLTIDQLTGNTGLYAAFNGGNDLIGLSNGTAGREGLRTSGSQIRVLRGSLTINQAMTFGQGLVALQAGSGITQAAGAPITASLLSVRNEWTAADGLDTTVTSGNIDLMANNAVTWIQRDAGDISSGLVRGVALENFAPGGFIRFNNTSDIVIANQSVNGLVQANGMRTTDPTSATDPATNFILLRTTGAIRFDANVIAGDGLSARGTVYLQAATGIDQTPDDNPYEVVVNNQTLRANRWQGGGIFAERLAVLNTTSGDIFLNSDGSLFAFGSQNPVEANSVRFFSGRNNAAGGVLAFKTGTDLQLGAADLNPDFNAGNSIQEAGRSLVTTGGGRILIGSLRDTILNEDIVNNGGDVIIEGAVQLGRAGDNVINTRFTGGYTYNGGGRIIITGNINGGSGASGSRNLVLLTPVGAELAGFAAPGVYFGSRQIGTDAVRLGSLRINDDDLRLAIPDAATVVFGVAPTSATAFEARPNYTALLLLDGPLTLGRFERTSVMGTLTIGSATRTAGAVTLGDLSTLGGFNVFASSLTFNRRDGGPNLSSATGSDQGLNLTFGGPVNLNGLTPTFAGSGSVAVTNADGTSFGGFRPLLLGEALSPASFFFASNTRVLSLALAGFAGGDLAVAFPSPVPALGEQPGGPESGVGSVEGVDGLLVSVRGRSAAEAGDAAGGSLVLVDMPAMEQPGPFDFRAASIRLNPAQLSRLAELYRQLTIGLGADGPFDATSARAEALRVAWTQFAAERRVSPARAPLAFRGWLESQAEAGTASDDQREALATLNRIRDLFSALEQTGLTRAETRGPRITVLRMFGGQWLPGTDYDGLQTAAIGAPTLAAR